MKLLQQLYEQQQKKKIHLLVSIETFFKTELEKSLIKF